MSKRADRLITLARQMTENEDFSDTSGIIDSELFQWINDAQYRLLNLVTNVHQQVFVKEAPEESVIKGQEIYDLPRDILLENRVVMVEFSHSGNTRDFKKLEKGTISQREPNSSGQPNIYIRRSGKILLSPIPSDSTGLLRISYQRRIAELAPRIGRVSAVTLDNSARTITSLTLDTTQSDFNSTALNDEDFLCFVNALGIQQMSEVQIDSVDDSTGVVTVTGTFVFVNGETIAVGDFVVGGDNSTTHSELPITCERYILGYLIWKILKRDSSEDSSEQRNEITSISKEIIESFAEADDDITFIPLIDEED